MKMTFHQLYAKGIENVFRYTHFRSIEDFIYQYNKHMRIPHNDISTEQIGDFVYKLRIDFGDMISEFELVFNERFTLQHVN